MSRYLKSVCTVILVICMLTVTVFAEENLAYDGYNYDAYGTSTPAPEGYEPILRIKGEDMECGAFNSPQDIFYAENGEIYIAD